MHLAGPNILVIFTLLIGAMNLLTPFITRNDSVVRTNFLLTISLSFVLNVAMLDYVFLKGIVARITIFRIDQYSIGLSLESVGMIFLNMLAVLWVVALLYTIKFIKLNKFVHSSRFLFFINASIMSGFLIALSDNLLTMFIAYEILTLMTIPLIIHTHNPTTTKGLLKYLKILMVSALMLFLPAIIIIYSHAGHGNFIKDGYIYNYFNNWQSILLLLLFIFGIAKSAIFPVHGWLPAAMVASYPVSALLHAVVVVKAGLFCTYKIFVYVFGLVYLNSIFKDFNWLVILPITTILYCGFKALKTKEIKMILAYSTITQLSIALMSLFLLSYKGFIAAILHMVSHSFSKICLFYCAGNIYSVNGATRVNDYYAVAKYLPKTSLAILIAALSLAGVPPFAGFISKLYILLAAVEQNNLLVVLTIIISSIMTIIYMSRIIIFLYTKNEIINNDYTESSIHPLMFLSIYLCIAAIFLFFFIKEFIIKFIWYI